MRNLESYARSILRIVVGLLFCCHGLQKLVGMFGGIPALRRNGCGLLSSPRSAGSVAHSKWRGTGGAVLLHLSVPVGGGSRSHQLGSAGSAREEESALTGYGLRRDTHVIAAPMQTMIAAENTGR